MTTLAEPAPAASPRAGKGGPRTPEGKKRSALNAMRHGLRARHFVLLPDEDRAAFDALVADLTDDLEPEGRIEVELVGKVAVCLWKEMRGDRMEGELLAWLGGGRGPGTLGKAMGCESTSEHEMNRVIRYQGYTDAQLNRTLAALHARQDRRRAPAEAGPRPAAGEPARVPVAPAAEPAEVKPESKRTHPVAEAPPADPATAVAAELDALFRGEIPPGGRAAGDVEALLARAEAAGVLPATEPEPAPRAGASGRGGKGRGGPAHPGR